MKLMRSRDIDTHVLNFISSVRKDPGLVDKILESWETDNLIWPGNFVRILQRKGSYEHALGIYISEQDKIASGSPTHELILSACGF